MNQLKRGEINEQELAARQKEIDELVAQAASLRARRSMKDRLSTSRDSQLDLENSVFNSLGSWHGQTLIP